jgi:hypothetical protein
MPFDEVNGLGKTQVQLEQEGILVDSVPEPDQVQMQSKNSVMYINPSTKEIWYEYIDIPKTNEQILIEKVDSLQSSLIEAQNAINVLLGICGVFI